MMPSGLSARPARGTARAGHLPGSVQRRDRAGAVLLVIFLAATGVESTRLGAANVFADSGRLDIERWASASPPPGVQDLNRAVDNFSDSLRYASANPWALEGLGALGFARMRVAGNPPEALAAARDAYKRFREALRQRPTSPFLWANLALSKLYLDEIDAELFVALRHADELGPWEPAIQQTTLFVALAVWPHLDAGLRQSVVRRVERGATRDAEKLFAIVKSYGRFDLVCGIDEYASIAGPNCKQAATTARPIDKRGRQ